MIYSGSWRNYQCKRKKGHGKNGDYCKQHGKKYPESLGKVSEWYQLTDWDYLYKLPVVEVTDTNLIISHDGKTTSSMKRTNFMFPSKRQAYMYALERAEIRVNNIKKKIEELGDKDD